MGVVEGRKAIGERYVGEARRKLISHTPTTDFPPVKVGGEEFKTTI